MLSYPALRSGSDSYRGSSRPRVPTDGAGAYDPKSPIWQRVDDLIEAAPGLSDLRAHGLHLLAARRWRALGRHVPRDLVEDEVQAIVRTCAVPPVLANVRAAWEGPIVVMKGPVVASRFPAPSRRPFGDLDLLVADAPSAQEALIAAGFVPGGDPAKFARISHHLRPLRLPDSPIYVELHNHPKWVDGLQPPSLEALFEEAQPMDFEVDDLLTLAPAHHVLVLAAHLWAHDPLTLPRILDVALMKEEVDEGVLESVARSWGVARLWRTTSHVSDNLFGTRLKQPLALRISGRGMKSGREATVVELQVGRFLNPFTVYRPMHALRVVVSAFGALFGRRENESWRRKLVRTAKQLAQPSMRYSDHIHSIVGDDEHRESTEPRDPSKE